MMKSRILLFGCILAILLGISSILLLNWRQKATRCQRPLLTTIPSPMPKRISGLFARVESLRDRYRRTPSWWERNSDFPQPDPNYPDSVEGIAIQGANIWTIYYTDDAIQRYDMDTGEQKIYRLIDDEEIDWVRHILITRDEEVWVAARLNKSYALARFDAAANAFKSVEGNNPFSIWDWRDGRLPEWGVSLKETADGNLLIPFQKNIYLYNPRENHTQLLLPNDFGFSVQSLAVSSNSFWFTVNETKDVWNLNWVTKEMINYGSAPKESDGSIAVDNLGRVWLGYFARLERNVNGEYQWWYPETYPTEFITLVSPHEDSLSGKDELEYRWSRVHKIFIASDESIWFLVGSGIVKYDPHENTWCLSAPAVANSIAEDKYGNLWIAPKLPASQGLYKYKLLP